MNQLADDHHSNRRQFLRSAGQTAVALAAASQFAPAVLRGVDL
jgi:hypothetical protein